MHPLAFLLNDDPTLPKPQDQTEAERQQAKIDYLQQKLASEDIQLRLVALQSALHSCNDVVSRDADQIVEDARAYLLFLCEKKETE